MSRQVQAGQEQASGQHGEQSGVGDSAGVGVETGEGAGVGVEAGEGARVKLWTVKAAGV